MKKAKSTPISIYRNVVSYIKHHKTLIYWLLPFIVFGLYLNTANNHFYHRLHSAGLLWPQNQTNYLLGNNGSHKLTYVALGDSLTTGVGASDFIDSYSYQVAAQILKPDQSIELTPLATPGYKSIDLVTQYLDKAIKLHPDIVTILIGVNDVHGLSPSPSDFRENYEQLVSRLHKESSAQIYLVAIPIIGTNGLIWPPFKNYYSYRTNQFNKIIKDLSEKYSSHYIDLYTPTLSYAHKSSDYYSKDDFHPANPGYRIWANIIAHAINQ